MTTIQIPDERLGATLMRQTVDKPCTVQAIQGPLENFAGRNHISNCLSKFWTRHSVPNPNQSNPFNSCLDS